MSANGNTSTGAPPGDMVIRDVADDDMEAVREIYSHHVLDGLASFEEVPTLIVNCGLVVDRASSVRATRVSQRRVFRS